MRPDELVSDETGFGSSVVCSFEGSSVSFSILSKICLGPSDIFNKNCNRNVFQGLDIWGFCSEVKRKDPKKNPSPCANFVFIWWKFMQEIWGRISYRQTWIKLNMFFKIGLMNPLFKLLFYRIWFSPLSSWMIENIFHAIKKILQWRFR